MKKHTLTPFERCTIAISASYTSRADKLAFVNSSARRYNFTQEQVNKLKEKVNTIYPEN